MANNGKVATNEKQGFLSKITSSFTGIITGILLLMLGIGMLWTNEQNNVRNIKNVDELRKQVIEVSSSKIDDKNDGKLIVTSGKLDYNEGVITDEDFKVSETTPYLVRKVEIYQLVEETDDDDNVKCTEKEWKEGISSLSDKAIEKGCKNPSEDDIKYESDEFLTDETLKVGAFTLISDFKKLLSASKKVTIDENLELPEGYKVYNNYITNSEDPSNPKVGDIRISYTKNDWKEASVLGKQIDDTIGAYTTKKNTSIKRIVEGTKNSADIIGSIEKGAKASKWLWRIFGSLMIIMAIGLILGPITTIIGYIPFLGKIANSMIGVVSFLIGLSISLLVIAISWFAARPITSIILIAVIAGLIAALVYFKKNKAVPAEKTNN